MAADEGGSIAEGRPVGPRGGQPTDHLLQGIADEVLASELFQEVQARIQELSDRVARLERLERRVGEFEGRLWTVDDLRQGLHHARRTSVTWRSWPRTSTNASASRPRGSPRSRTSWLPRKSGPNDWRRGWRPSRPSSPNGPFDKERAHVEAQRRDQSEIVTLGETYEVVVKDVEDGYAPSAMGWIDGLVVWFDIDDPEKVSEGHVVEVRINDLRENVAKATLLEVLDDE